MISVVVTFAAEGFHRWPAAPPPRDYLAARHRHLFRVRAAVEVDGPDRQVECHDFRAFCADAFGSGEFGDLSCEHMAARLADAVLARYGPRRVEVEVMEDGEVGGGVVASP